MALHCSPAPDRPAEGRGAPRRRGAAALVPSVLALILLTFPLPPVAAASGDWVATGPEESGAVLGLFTDPEDGRTVYLVAEEGLLVSRDRGTTWEPPALPGVRTLALSRGERPRLYAVTRGRDGTWQLWRSDDRARHWRRLAKVPDGAAASGPGSSPTTPAAAPPAEPDQASTGATPGEVEAEGTVPPAAPPAARPEVRALAVEPSDPDTLVLAGRTRPGGEVASRGRLWLSRDGGDTLTVLPPEEAVEAEELLFGRHGVLFAATADGVFRSRDQGRTWQPARRGLEVHPLGGPAGPLGAAPPAEEPPRGRHLAVHRLAVSAAAPEVLYAGTGPGAGSVLFRSRDGGDSWQTATEAVPRGRVAALLVDREDRRTLYAAVAGAGVWGTRGDGWSAVEPALPDGADPVALALLGDGTLLVATAAGDVLRLAPPPPACVDDATTLCLAGRFRVELQVWGAEGTPVAGRAVPLTRNGGWFWLTDPETPELAVKVVDGRAVDRRWWIYHAALTDAGGELRVLDVESGVARVYPLADDLTAGVDTEGFAAPADGEGGDDDTWLAPLPDGGCGDDSIDLCLWGGRFRVEVDWETAAGGGAAPADRLSPQAGWFRFAAADEPELLVKVVDGRAVNGHWWVVFGGLTQAAYEVRVSDTASGQTVSYGVPAGEPTSHADPDAFAAATGP